MNRENSNLSKNIAFKVFKNLGLFMTMKYICFWQHQSTSRGRWALKRLLMEVVSHLGKKLLLPGLFDIMLYKLDMQDSQGNDWWTCLKVRWFFRDDPYCFMKESARHSARHRRKWLTNCQYRWNCLWNFLLYGKVCWRKMPQQYRRTLDDYSGSKMSLSILKFWKLLIMHFLFT